MDTKEKRPRETEIKIEALPLEQHKKALFDMLLEKAPTLPQDEVSVLFQCMAFYSIEDALEFAKKIGGNVKDLFEGLVTTNANFVRHGKLIDTVYAR